MKYADLHLHTTASDGTQSLEERIKQAKQYGLDCIAITDHDVINSSLKFRYTSYSRVEVITGAEIKAKLKTLSIEILGYFLDPKDMKLKSLLCSIRENRVTRMREMISKVNQLLDADICLAEVKSISEASMGRPHLATSMVQRNLVKSMKAAFNGYLGEGRPAYVSIDKPSYSRVIEAIHQNGGLAVLSHPGTRKFTNVERALKTLKSSGLDGIEVFYPYDRSSPNFNFGVGKARKLAKQFDFLITGGSDCHGQGSSKFAMGRIKLPYKYVEILKEKLQ